MRDLFDRMYSRGTRQYPAIAVHTLPSYLADYGLGGRTRKQVTAAFNMIDRDRLETNRLMDQVDAQATDADKIALITFFEYVMRIEEVAAQPNRQQFKKRLNI